MAEKLKKFTLDFDEKKEKWDLTNDKTNKVVKKFDSKQEATSGGALKEALGKDGGSVKIQKKDGKFQEERTYPKGKDPKKSKG